MDAVDWQQALVCSQAADGEGVAGFRRFVQDARRLSQRHAVRGALLFDGETSLHLVEGAPAAVADFLGQVYPGSGQLAVKLVARRSGRAAVLPPRWCAGYAEPQALDACCAPGPAGADAGAAIQRFLALLAEADCA
jgi:hypothetical protein